MLGMHTFAWRRMVVDGVYWREKQLTSATPPIDHCLSCAPKGNWAKGNPSISVQLPSIKPLYDTPPLLEA